MKNALCAVTLLLQTIDIGSAWSLKREGSYFRGEDRVVVAAGGWSSSAGRGSLRLAPHRGGCDADSDSGTQSVAAAGRGQVSSAVRTQ